MKYSKNKQSVQIREVSVADAKRLLEIYKPYVEETAITFEYEVPSVEEFAERIKNTQERYPYLVAQIGDEIVGYAYAGPFKERAAYDWSVETSIYVDRERRKEGIGKALYEALEKALQNCHILNVNACIAYTQEEDAHLDNNSVEFHQHFGYKIVGHFHQCGYKFHHWYDMVWMEKYLGEHLEDPLPVHRWQGK